MAISGNYNSPITVNGYTCRNCSDVEKAKKNIDPADPTGAKARAKEALGIAEPGKPQKPFDPKRAEEAIAAHISALAGGDTTNPPAKTTGATIPPGEPTRTSSTALTAVATTSPSSLTPPPVQGAQGQSGASPTSLAASIDRAPNTAVRGSPDPAQIQAQRAYNEANTAQQTRQANAYTPPPPGSLFALNA